jgi:formylglycine-generating enzyme required for sulfatase activity
MMADRNFKKMDHQVFISYRYDQNVDKKDRRKIPGRRIANRICSKLEAENIRCWIGPRDVPSGEIWIDLLIEAVEQSKVLVLVYSSTTNESQWVQNEITLAMKKKNIKIIPIRVDSSEPQGILKILEERYQWIDASKPPLGKHLDKLVKDVQEHLERFNDDQDPKPPPPKPKKKIKVIISISVVLSLILVIFAVGYFMSRQEKMFTIETPDVIRTLISSGEIDTSKNERDYWEVTFKEYGFTMVYIPEGEFTMGLADQEKESLINERRKKDFDLFYKDETPSHKVYLDGYWMGKYEVTNAQYVKFLDDSKTGLNDKMAYIKSVKGEYVVEPGYENHPVVGISWYDAKDYCDWLSKKTDLPFKLPTEARWERAAKGIGTRIYPWGNSFPSGEKVNIADKQLWLKAKHEGAYKDVDDGYAYTAPVNSFPGGVSPYELLNMSGNVSEWCYDWYDTDYYKNVFKDSNGLIKNPDGPKNGTYRVLRGGSWYTDARSVRCTNRHKDLPSKRSDSVGFRLCLDIKGIQ